MSSLCRLLPCLGIVLSLGSCMSYKTSRPIALEETPDGWEKLPYHVAIVPVDGRSVDPVLPGRDGVELNYQFSEGSEAKGKDAITTSLSDVLTQNVFNRVTVLTPPSPEQYALLEGGGLDAYWVAAAREVKADMLLDVDSFSYPNAPKSSGLLQSYLLFFAGPLELMFPDREYTFEDMSLAVSLYDVGQLIARSEGIRAGTVKALEQLADEGAEADEKSAMSKQWDSAKAFRLADGGVVRQFRLQPDALNVRFGDRYGKGPGSPGFWTTLIVPSAFLAQDSEQFGEKLSKDASVALAQDLARDIFEGDSAFILSPQSSTEALKLDVAEASLSTSGGFGEEVLEFRAPYTKPNGELGSSQVRLGAFTFDVRELGGEDADKGTIQGLLQDGDAVAVVQPNTSSESRMPDELILYVPANAVGQVEAGFSGAAPMDVLQLTLAEDRPSGGDLLQSWTFELDGALGEAQVTKIREASFKAQAAAPIEASMKKPASEDE